MAEIRVSQMPALRETSRPSGMSSPSVGARKRMNSSSVPSPVAATRMIGHGACDALITPPARRNATTPVATISSHGTCR